METIVTYGNADFTTPVVSLTLAKMNANIQYDDQDSLLQLFLIAAIEDAEQYTGTAIQQKDVTIQLKDWAEFVDLPAVPLTTVTSIVYKDADGNNQTLDTDDYQVLNGGYQIRFSALEFPELEASNRFPITITGKVGFTDSTIPKAIQSAILLKFAYKEMYREDAPKTGSDRSFKSALRPFKLW